LLLLNEDYRSGPTRHAYGQVLAQPEQPVIPALARIDERKGGQVGMLLTQQCSDQA
jgi:hypothetical protein